MDTLKDFWINLLLAKRDLFGGSILEIGVTAAGEVYTDVLGTEAEVAKALAIMEVEVKRVLRRTHNATDVERLLDNMRAEVKEEVRKANERRDEDGAED